MTMQSGVLESELVDVSAVPLDQLGELDGAEFSRCVGVVVRGSVVEVTQAVADVDVDS